MATKFKKYSKPYTYYRLKVISKRGKVLIDITKNKLSDLMPKVKEFEKKYSNEDIIVITKVSEIGANT